MIKVAIPTENGMLCQHFGHAPQFTFFDIENSKVVGKELKDSPEHEPGTFPKFISANNANVLIAGGLGSGAIQYLEQEGIEIKMGAPFLPVDELIQMYLQNSLTFNGQPCEGQHKENHSCGNDLKS